MKGVAYRKIYELKFSLKLYLCEEETVIPPPLKRKVFNNMYFNNYIKKTLCVTVLSIQFILSSQLVGSQFEVLVRDMKEYKTTNARFHAGHVFEHSLWVARSTINLLNTHWSTRTNDLFTPKTLIIASLLHDIGKCGDGVFSFKEKPAHPREGFLMLTGSKPYVLKDGSTFNFGALYDELRLTHEQVAIIALIAGMHHDLGAVMRGMNAGDDKAPAVMLAKLDAYIHEAGADSLFSIRTDKLYRKLLKIICLISVADVISAQVVVNMPSHYLISDFVGIDLSGEANAHAEDLSEGMDGYTYFKYDDVGVRSLEALLSV